jgi:hypothetical protein
MTGRLVTSVWVVDGHAPSSGADRFVLSEGRNRLLDELLTISGQLPSVSAGIGADRQRL